MRVWWSVGVMCAWCCDVGHGWLPGLLRVATRSLAVSRASVPDGVRVRVPTLRSRPKSMKEIAFQEEVVHTLENSIRTGNVRHAG